MERKIRGSHPKEKIEGRKDERKLHPDKKWTLGELQKNERKSRIREAKILQKKYEGNDRK